MCKDKTTVVLLVLVLVYSSTGARLSLMDSVRCHAARVIVRTCGIYPDTQTDTDDIQNPLSPCLSTFQFGPQISDTDWDTMRILVQLQILLLVQLLPAVTVAFHVGSLATTSSPSSTSVSALFASSNRRDVLAVSASTVVSTLLVSCQQSLAEGTGKIVQFEIANLEDGSSGVVQIQLEPDWAPKGVARLEELVGLGFYQNCRFFRVLPGFVAQFGIAGDPTLQAKWKSNPIVDDPVRVTNERGTVVFATAGPNTRTTQLFINTNPRGNGFLDKQGFSPVGRVIQGMDLVDKLYSGYGEGAPSGRGPSQGMIQAKGNSYLEEGFPKLSYIANAKFL